MRAAAAAAALAAVSRRAGGRAGGARRCARAAPGEGAGRGARGGPGARADRLPGGLGLAGAGAGRRGGGRPRDPSLRRPAARTARRVFVPPLSCGEPASRPGESNRAPLGRGELSLGFLTP